MPLTRAALEKFVTKRNESDYSTNLQVQFDAHDCGFRIEDLGDIVKEKTIPMYEDGTGEFVVTWAWHTPHGILREDQERDYRDQWTLE